ncbi:copper amine oxidase [Coniochaeta sp. 2T2.1]|nr:copper amine oxidase [Coniochaeta sp. 2T2.1]
MVRFRSAWLLGCLAAAATLASARLEPDLFRRAMNVKDDVKLCHIGDDAPTTKAPKANVWAQITPEESKSVWDFVHDPAQGLNITDPGAAKLTDNYLYFIDTLPVNKTTALGHVDGDDVVPTKYARVVIFEGGKPEPISQEYMVKLPITADSELEKLDYLFNGGLGGTVPFNGRFFDGKRTSASEPLLKSVMTNISDITIAIFGGAYYGSGDNRTNLSSTTNTPISFDGSSAFRSVMFRYPGLASYMLPLDFYVILDVSGTDASLYTLKGFVTKTHFFPTEPELRAAFEAGELEQEFPQTRDNTWAYVNHKPEMGQRALEDRLAPQSLEIGGKRYKFDPDEQYVEYMGWTFYMAFTRMLGLMFYDVRFKGERILYELSMQEAAAQYGGNQPKAAGTAICLWEADTGFPLARHRTGSGNAWGFSQLGSVKSSSLNVRTVATVGNYDYMFSYAFNVDGSLEVEVRASGYLQSSAYYKDQDKFGPRIYQGTQGSLHDHVVTFKADFDIVDAANSLQVTDLVVANQTQPWFEELGIFEQMELNTANMAVEQQFDWAANGQSMYCVVNNNRTNAWGVKRGYRIVPGKSNVHLSVLKSPFSKSQSTFSKSHLAVTQRHDEETYANSWQNINLASKPQHDFAKFFDGESVDDEDIVVWFNLGMHHFTRSEDVPVTLYTEAVSSITFAPQNFFDRAQEGDLLNRRWIVADSTTGELSYEDYGVELPTCKVELGEPVDGILPWNTI